MTFCSADVSKFAWNSLQQQSFKTILFLKIGIDVTPTVTGTPPVTGTSPVTGTPAATGNTPVTDFIPLQFRNQSLKKIDGVYFQAG